MADATKTKKVVVATIRTTAASRDVVLRTARPILAMIPPPVGEEVVEVRGTELVVALTVTTVTLMPTNLLHEAPIEIPGMSASVARNVIRLLRRQLLISLNLPQAPDRPLVPLPDRLVVKGVRVTKPRSRVDANA